MKMINSDKNKDKGKPFNWTGDALKRLERVPQGFMRDMTKVRIEKYAEEIGTDKVTLEIAEKGLAGARNAMSSMIDGASPAASQKKEEIKTGEKSDFKIDEDVDYYYCDICGYTVKGYPLDECPICRSVKEKFKLVENKKEFITASSGRVLNWTEEARKRLTKTPEGFMRDMTKWRIEAFVRKSGSPTVTAELIEKKYEYWGEGSKNITKEMEWDAEAKEKINKIPSFVRGMVIKEVENEAQKTGTTTVTQEILSKVRTKWSSSMEFHSEHRED